MLEKLCSKFSKQGFNSMWTETFQMFQLDLEKAEESEIKLPTSTGSQKVSERVFQKKPISFWFTDYTKAFDYVDQNKLWRIPLWEYQTTLTASCNTCMQVKKQQLDPEWNNGLVPNRERSM